MTSHENPGLYSAIQYCEIFLVYMHSNGWIIYLNNFLQKKVHLKCMQKCQKILWLCTIFVLVIVWNHQWFILVPYWYFSVRAVLPQKAGKILLVPKYWNASIRQFWNTDILYVCVCQHCHVLFGPHKYLRIGRYWVQYKGSSLIID